MAIPRTLAIVCALVSLVASEPQARPRAPERKAPDAPPSDMAVAQSVAVTDYKLQSVGPRSRAAAAAAGASSGKRYGYPYLIAPTLPPFLQKARADVFDNEAVHVASVPQVKSYGSRLSDDGLPLKKSHRKKHKLAFAENANRRQGYDEDEDETSAERRLRTYREPTYRNFHDLESVFMPRRRMDTGITFTDYGYPAKASRRPEVSPRDPFLSPSLDPTDSFYPSGPKLKSHSSSYSSSPGKIGYGAGAYDGPGDYDVPPPPVHSTGGLVGYDAGPPKYPSSGGHYDYDRSYSIESNKPIVGDIRKRLLDFAGASDLYEGEPDYLKEVARNKHKYGSIGNDYYPYGGPGNSFRDFYYGESKTKESRDLRV